MANIKDITARQILDSRGYPTIETTVSLDSGISSSASVPSGASTGSHEALELRDNDPNLFFGKSVYKACAIIRNKIRPLLKGIDIERQDKIDKSMIECDGTENKNKFGANAILSVSLAAARCAAKNYQLPLFKYITGLYSGKLKDKQVTPIFNIINGGLHAAGSVSFQEFFIIPKADLFADSLQTGCEIYHSLKQELSSLSKNTNVGDEGGFAPYFESNEKVLDLLTNISKNTDCKLGLDVAASTFFKKNLYQPEKKSLSVQNYLDFIIEICRKFNLDVVEDALSEDAWSDWKKLTYAIGNKTRVIGDDLLVTNPTRLIKAITESACNGILVKLNQIGTLSETLEVIKIARDADFTVIVSHRSGETTDDFIADLAVGVGADYVKFGAPARGERVVKYNRLLKIYDMLQK